MGVPVRHQRRTDLRLAAALNCLEPWLRIQWAVLWSAAIMAKGQKASLSVSDVGFNLAFIEHNSVPAYLVQNASVIAPGSQSGVGREHDVKVL